MRDRSGVRDRSSESRLLLWIPGYALTLLSAGLAVVSWGFGFETPFGDRPFLPLAGILAAAFFCWLFAARYFWDKSENIVRGRDIFWLALLMRLPLLLGSQPIQEIDYYRYLWDGRCAVEGISPYRYSPADLDRLRTAAAIPQDAASLLAAQQRSTSLETIFLRIDHREVPTIYPLVSQMVFALAARITPETAPPFVHMAVLRGLIGAFDLGTVVLLLCLLRRLALPLGRAIAYAWCPLVLKEFTNASHMDAIAVFFTLAAFLTASMAWQSRHKEPFIKSPGFLLPITALLLALGILTKWYPLAMVPIFLSFAWRRWRWQTLPALVMAVVVIGTGHFVSKPSPGKEAKRDEAAHSELAGMRAFLSRWEMNDLIFSVIRENLRPTGIDGLVIENARPEPWYAVTPESVRRVWADAVNRTGHRLGIDGLVAAPDFLAAQLFCGGLLALLAAWLTFRRRSAAENSPVETGRALFLIMAASWYLSATQNPWYWTWGLPFVVFTRSRVWLWVPGFALIYYARFWLTYQYPAPFRGDYDGQRFFEEIVVWFEHLPMLLAIGWLGLKRWMRVTGNRVEEKIPQDCGE